MGQDEDLGIAENLQIPLQRSIPELELGGNRDRLHALTSRPSFPEDVQAERLRPASLHELEY